MKDKIPADIVFTLTLCFLPASNASTWLNQQINALEGKTKGTTNPKPKETSMITDKITFVSLSSAAFAELMPPP